ncbi:MAG: hypothetical protein ACOY0T_20840 [Myxococcota bacterium]
MNDPKRWLDQLPHSECIERRLLEAARRIHCPENVDQSWVEFVQSVGPLALAASSSAASAETLILANDTATAATTASTAGGATTSVAAATLKALIVGLALGGVGISASHTLLEPRERPPMPSAPTANVASVSATPARSVSSVDATARPESALPASRTTTSTAAPRKVPDKPSDDTRFALPEGRGIAPLSSAIPAGPRGFDLDDNPPERASERENQLIAEARELAAAQGLLRSGQTDAALQMLEQSSRRFGNGGMVQEREALIIEALLHGSRPELGVQRARAFLARYPATPLAARVRGWLERK